MTENEAASEITPLDRAINACGGVSNLAAAIGRKQNVVSNWRLRGQVPAEACIDVEKASGVSRYELRPDVFGERADDPSRQFEAANDGGAAGTTDPLKDAA